MQATKLGLSERQACHLAKVTRSSVRYVAHSRESQQLSDQVVQERLGQMKASHPRFGSPRIHALLAAELKAEGKTINHKRVERIWRKCGLQVPQRPKKRKIKTGRMVSSQAEHPNHVWCYDFQADALVSGRKLRLLNILDELRFYWGHPRMVVGDGRRVSHKPGDSSGVEATISFVGHSALRSQRQWL